MKKSNLYYIGVTSVLYIISTLVLMYANWNGDLILTAKANKIYFLLMPFFFILTFLAHRFYHKNKQSNYLSGLFVGNVPREKRIMYLDYARCLALLLVILNHTCSSQLLIVDERWKYNVYAVVSGFALIANALYIMISGILLLQSNKKESLSEFYYNRFIKVVLPFIIYYFIMLYISGAVILSSPSSIFNAFKTILSGATSVAPQYWLIYVFISFYLFAPFIKIMIDSMSDKSLLHLGILILIIEGLINYLHYVDINLGLTYVFGNWIGVFILGYLLVNRLSEVGKNVVIVLGFISTIILISVALNKFSETNYFGYTAPTSIMMAASILILLSRLENSFHKHFKFYSLIASLSKYSYVMLLVHWYGLFAIVMNRLNLLPGQLHCFGIIYVSLSAFIISYLLGFICENTIIISFRYILDKLKYKINSK